MKPAIASLVLALVFCGHTKAQEPSQSPDALDQGPPSSMLNPPAPGPPAMPPAAAINWWKDPELVQKLHISDDQIQKIEKIAHAQQIQEIDLRADLEKQYAILRFQMETDPPDQVQVLAQFDKITQARGRLEKSQVEMLLALRRVLTTEQAKMVRDLQPRLAPPAPGFGPPGGGPEGPPEGGPGAPRGGPPEPPPNGGAS